MNDSDPDLRFLRRVVLKITNKQHSPGTDIRADAGGGAGGGSWRPARVSAASPVLPGSWRGAAVVGVGGSRVILQLTKRYFSISAPVPGIALCICSGSSLVLEGTTG